MKTDSRLYEDYEAPVAESVEIRMEAPVAGSTGGQTPGGDEEPGEGNG